MGQKEATDGTEPHGRLSDDHQNMFRFLVENSKDVIFRHQSPPGSRTVYISPSCLRLFGYSQDEFMSNPDLLSSLFHPDDVTIFLGLLDGSIPYSEPAVARMMAKDGSVLWTEHCAIPHRSKDGLIIGIDSFCRDISERMRSSQEIIIRGRKIEELLQRTENLIESAPMAIMELDANFRLINHNSHLMQYMLSEWPDDGIIGKHLSDVLRADGGSLMDMIEACRLKKRPAHNRFLPLRIAHGDRPSRTAVYDVSVAPLIAPDRSLSSILVMMRDISELGELDRERSSMTDLLWVMSSVESMQGLLDNSIRVLATSFGVDAGAIFLMDSDFDKLFLESQYGLSEDERIPLDQSLGMEPSFLFSSLDSSGRESAEDSIAPLLLEAFRSTDLPFAMWAQMTSGPHVLGYVLLMSRDRSSFNDQTQIFFKIQVNTLAYAVQRMQMLGESERSRGEAATYLDLLCHDIANYSTALMSFSELIEDNADTPDTVKIYAQDMRSQVRVISTMIERLRRLTGVSQQPASLTEVDLVPCIVNLIARQMEGAEGDSEISIDFDPSATHAIALADSKIEEAIENILVNSIENTVSESIDVTISVSESSQRGHDYWEIVIEDRGTGIPDEVKANLLDPSKDYWEIKRGFGMGLFISKMIIERSRGQISIEDRVAGDWTKGTRVTIALLRGG